MDDQDVRFFASKSRDAPFIALGQCRPALLPVHPIATESPPSVALEFQPASLTFLVFTSLRKYAVPVEGV